MKENQAKVIKIDDEVILDLCNFKINPFDSDEHRLSHSHPKLEISLVKEGRGVYGVEDRTYEMQEGDIFLFNNIESHVIREVTSKNAMINMVIHFEPKLICSFESYWFDVRYLKIFFDRDESFQNRLDRHNPAVKEIREQMLAIEQEFIQASPEYEQMVKVKLLNLLVLLVRHFGSKTEPGESLQAKKKDLVHMNHVYRYIDHHLGEEIRLEDAAATLYMHPAYFSTFFKKYNGIAFTRYVAMKRVYRAVDYLKASDKSILEIAGLCGFNNAAHFNKTFKTITGTVPSSYRK